MEAFAAILEAARTRHGAAALEARLPTPKAPAELAATPDDRCLSEMSRRIFRAGLRHALVAAKWPAFEEVFHGFDPRRVRAMPDEALEALLADARLIRHWGKLSANNKFNALTMDIVLKLVNYEPLLSEHALDQIANRNDAHQPFPY